MRPKRLSFIFAQKRKVDAPMQDEQNSLTIPAKFYAGFYSSQGGMMSARIVPDGTDSLAIRRKLRVDDWIKWTSRGRPPSEYSPTAIFDNVPTVGFRLCCDSGNHKDDASVQWQVQDPRGFKVTITALNAIQLLRTCNFLNGEILEECVWTRFSSYNLLVSTSSQQYKNAARNTDRMSKRVSLRQLKTGNHITTVNGISGVFLGTYYPINKMWRSGNIEIGTTKRAVIAQLNADGSSIEDLRLIAALKVSEITNDSSAPEIDCLVRLNDYISNNGTIDGLNYPIIGFTGSNSLNSQTGVRLEPIQYNELNDLEGDLICQLDEKTYCICHIYDIRSQRPDILLHDFDVQTLSIPRQGNAFAKTKVSRSDLQKFNLFRMSNYLVTAEGINIRASL